MALQAVRVKDVGFLLLFFILFMPMFNVLLGPRSRQVFDILEEYAL